MKYLRHILPVFVAVLILFFSLVSSVTAASNSVISYQDYVSSTDVNFDKMDVTCTFPYSLNSISVFDLNDSGYSGKFNGVRYVVINDTDIVKDNVWWYHLEYFIDPFGDRYLLLPDIPHDSVFTFSWYLRFGRAFYDEDIIVESNLTATFYDDEFNFLTEDVIYSDIEYSNEIRIDNTFSLSELSLDNSAKYVRLSAYIKLGANAVPGFTIQLQVNDFNLVFPLGELAVIIDQNQQLINSNQAIKDALDQMQTGTSDQQAAADQFNSEVDQVIGELDDIGSQMNDVPRETIDVSQLVPTDILTGTHFLTYVNAINNFWDSPELVLIVVTLGGMILISYLLFGEKG